MTRTLFAATILAFALPAFAQDAEKKAPVRKDPPSACEKCQNDGIRQLMKCEAGTKKPEGRLACLDAYDAGTKACAEGACKAG